MISMILSLFEDQKLVYERILAIPLLAVGLIFLKEDIHE